MFKRTVVFSNPAYLHTKQNQLVISRAEQNDTTIPIEDIGIVLCDHDQIRITKTLLAKLLENNAAVVVTDGKASAGGTFFCRSTRIYCSRSAGPRAKTTLETDGPGENQEPGIDS